VTGVLLESQSAGRSAVIAHDDIPGYMSAMTMSFNVKQPAELQGLQRGDKISFQLFVNEKDAWIEDIKRTGGSGAIRWSPPPADSGPELKLGALVPDFVLTNQAGQAVHLRDFKGRALALTFFFSRCSLPTFCPLMNKNLAAVQQELQQSATGTNWQLLSISFDPQFDTVDLLGSLASYYHGDPQHWSFGTSSPGEIRKLGGAFGLKYWNENGSISHNLRTAVIDASGRLQKVFDGNEWQPAELVAEMRKAMEAGR
jgi:protein SCO1/2